jgi:hypothetical protein
MDGMGQFASRLIAVMLLASAWRTGMAQNTPRDGIDRNLLQRDQQEREFHVRLYDTARGVGHDTIMPLPPVPHSFVGPELYQPPSGAKPGGTASVSGPVAGSDRQQLDDSQLRRQLELQTQNKFMDEASRQQQSQIQQLQFGRENQAQHLQQQIQRDSGNLMQGLH